jgi:pSer/pThr/pTyr-binding forkhead associated (FHA) protein
MKLLVPNGEHAPVSLNEGNNRIGSAPGAQIVLEREGIAPWHCDISYSQGVASVTPASPDAQVSLNGQPVSQSETVRAGDALQIGPVQARVVAVERSAAPAARPAPVDDSGATRVRVAVPRFVLRGVSGAAFGKTYPVAGAQVIGRSSECDISIASEEISRRHAQVKPSPEGLMVEDLGSSNGTFINGKRVQNGILKPGEELRLDNIRFLLVAPGTEIPGAARTATVTKQTATKKSGTLGWVVGAIVVLAAAGAAAVFLL